MSTMAQYLAWKSIEKDATPLNLDKFQESQAATKTGELEKNLKVRIEAAYCWALAPRQGEPTSEVEWEEFKGTGEGSLAERAGARFETEWALRQKLPGVELRSLLDKYLWAERDHVSVGQLTEWFARYLYLPRLTTRKALEQAIEDGASVMTPEDTFAVAGAWDEAKKRYTGLKVGEGLPPVIDRTTLLLKTGVARAQRERDRARTSQPPAGDGGTGTGTGGTTTTDGRGTGVGPGGSAGPGTATAKVPPKQPPNVFVASVPLDPMRVVKETGRVVMEVLEHLSTLPDAEVEVTLEMRVKVPGGVKDDVVRTVTENAKTLKFQNASFERE